MTDQTVQAQVIEHRAAATEAQAAGDTNAANEAYARELAALAGNPTSEEGEQAEQEGTPVSTEAIENAFAHLTQEFGEETTAQLRDSWGSDAQENLALSVALAQDHPELESVLQDYGLADHPGLLAAGAVLARKLGYTFERHGTKTKETPMQNTNRESFARGMRDFNERIAVAQAEGDSKTVREIYQKQMEWIGRVKGNAPIVGSRQRNA